MTNYQNVKIIHTYQGKKVTKTFFINNRHLFTEPSPMALRSALDILDGMAHNKKSYSLFIDEKGEVSFREPL
jgi:hypothetical protein